MRSVQSRVFFKALRMSRRLMLSVLPKGESYIEKKLIDNAKQYNPPDIGMEIKQLDEMGFPVYEMGEGDKWIFYLHGGAYIEQPTIYHWRYLEKFVKAGFKVIFALYRKAPCCLCYDNVTETVAVFNMCRERFGDDVTVMGDSAGGGLALAMTQLLRDRELTLPRQLVLYSPWLNVSLDTQCTEQYAEKDWLYDIDNLRIIGSAYRGELPVYSPIASPLYGGSVVCKTYIYVGSDEIMLPDCLRFKHLNSSDSNVVLREFPYMQHCFAIMPMPEADLVFNEVIDIIAFRS